MWVKIRAVEADSGAIGGSASHEFTALSEYGEGVIAYCDSCDFAATTERAECIDESLYLNEEKDEIKEVKTPGVKTIEEVAGFLDIPVERMIKTLLYSAGEEIIAVLIRGDRELNEVKLINLLAIPEHMLEFASEEDVKRVTGADTGYSGPMGLKDIRIIMDSELKEMCNMTAGANKTGYHVQNINYGRDYEADIIIDLKLIKEGYKCPDCGKSINLARGIEVGQVFKLGTKYSKAMGAIYRDENMKEQTIIMGCYGIGVTRTLAAIVEQNYDENGIIWPMAIAPYEVVITIVNTKDEEQMTLGEEIYSQLKGEGVDVLLDDRAERPGVKFKDADLIGIPIRITVGKKASEKIVEFKLRKEKDKSEVAVDEVLKTSLTLVKEKFKY